MLAVYRVGVHIPTPGINSEALSKFLQDKGGALLGFLDIFSGGALFKLTIFALGIMPYISASIILQLLTVVIPTLSKLAKEGGERGRKKIIQYTRYGTIVISLVQSFGIAIGLQGMEGGFVQFPGLPFQLMTMLTLTSGTAFLMWLGEQITERGIGNGISLIIFAGIVVSLPNAILQIIINLKTGTMGLLMVLLLVALMVAVVGVIIFVERAQRRIPIQYPKRVVGRRIVGGVTNHLPLRVNTGGVIPVIFASSILAFPQTFAYFAHYDWLKNIVAQLAYGMPLYNLFYL